MIYGDDAKHRLVNVPLDLIDRFDAVSEQVSMARGAQQNANADIAVAVSGIAGPSGGDERKSVGTVCFTWAWPNRPSEPTTELFSGERQQIQQQAGLFALQHISQQLETS